MIGWPPISGYMVMVSDGNFNNRGVIFFEYSLEFFLKGPF